MAFYFEKSVDPENPIDIYDQPPDDWKDIDTNDYKHARFGFASCCFMECIEWQKREIKRQQVMQQ